MSDFHTKTFTYLALASGLFLICGGVIANQISYQAELDAGQLYVPYSHAQTLQTVAQKQNAKVLGAYTINAESWRTHKDIESPLTFRYPKTWMVVTENFPQDGQMYRLSVQPQTGIEAFTIFISKDRFFATEGLSGQPIKLGGGSGTNIENQMLAIKKGAFYYTIYAGTQQGYMPEFKQLLETIKF